MRTSRKQILFSIVSLVLCFSMLLGTTYAWFTDSATSMDNIVKSGKLDIALYWAEDLSGTNWKDVTVPENQAIFDYDKWEPGYTEVRHIKVVNEGDLAFKYAMKILPMGEVSKLAEVIDVYFLDPAAEITGRDQLKNPVGTLKQVIAGEVTANGKLEQKDDVAIVTIALKMRENAGNEYQGLSIGDSFSIQLTATQLSHESDVFDKNYDEAAKLPTINQTASGIAESDASGRLVSPLSLRGAGISANVPAGTQLAENTDQLTLTISDLDASRANVEVSDTEIASSLDVHVKGVSTDNTTPIEIAIDEYLPKGLNIGNYRLYHVEGNQTNEMSLLADGAAPAHNTFTYDPVTGDVVMYMATFSEVKLVADTENAWNGEIADAFAGGEGSDANPYLIANADQLALLGELISNDNENYGDKNYKLIANINLGGEENTSKGIIFYPIGYHKEGGTIALADLDIAPEFEYFEEDPDYAQARASAISEEGTTKWYTYGGAFCGVFDGNGNTISNIYQNTWQMKGNYDGHYWDEAMGIFGYVYDGTIKNLTVDNFTSDGEYTPTGVIAAYAASGATFENIAITNCNPRVYNTGNGGIVGIGGNNDDTATEKLTFTNITVDNSNKISALWGSWDVPCGGIMGMLRGSGSVHFENCHVGAQIDVFNDVCGNYQYYWYRYAGMVIGTIKNNRVDENGYTVPDVSHVTANNCTVHFGDWNDYYYCELVANTLASYTHDHQFSRLTEIASLDEIKSGDTWTKTGNFLLNNECYHIVNKNGTLTRHLHEDSGYETVGGETVLKENNQIVYLPFNQLFQGYGWGVKNIGFRNDSELDFKGITILDREEANSIDKFGAIVNGGSFEEGATVSIGEIFKALDGVSISANTLMVFVSPVGEGSTASAIYTPNTTDWTKGTLTFSGLGAAKIVINDYTYCKEKTTSLTITEPADKDKFTANNNLAYTHTLQGGTIDKTLGDIFSEIDGAKIDYANIKVEYITSGDVTVEFAQNIENWAASTIKFSGTGSVTFTINDKDHCNDATATVSVNHRDNADKFTVKEALNYTPKHDKETYTFTFGQLFTTEVKEFATDVVVTFNGTEYKFTKGDGWADESVTLTEFGTYAVTITDNNYCNVASNKVTFNEPKTEAKFEYVGADTYYGGQTVKMSDLFAQIDGTELGNNVIVTVNDTTTYNGADWQNCELKFNAVGAFVITIKENSNYCVATTITIDTQTPYELVNKFTGDFLYRVGNANTVAISSLFAVNSFANGVSVSDVNVTVENVKGDAAGAFTANNSDWTKGTIQFSGTGVVKVTISAKYTNPVELMLEVVDAVNATSATDAKATNVVLLNNISGGFTVSDGYAFYGNGFKVNCSGKGTYLNNGGLTLGYVNVQTGGTLDNVQVICDIYPNAFVYAEEVKVSSNLDKEASTSDRSRYMYQLSAISVSGDGSVISNCYAYGGRNNIFVGGGNVTIENTVTECGTLSNIQIAGIKDTAVNTVTIKDVTTIQYKNASTYDSTKIMLGLGIMVGDNESTANPHIILQGDLKQYNWVTSDDTSVSNTYAKTAIEGALAVTKYQHTINGKTAVNMGIAYLNAKTTSFLTENDQRTNKQEIPYTMTSVKISGQTGYVYSISDSKIDETNRYNAENDGVTPYKANAQRDIVPNHIFSLGNQTVNGEDRYLTGDINGITARYESGQQALTLDITKLMTASKYGSACTVNAICIDPDGNTLTGTVTLNKSGVYTLKFTVVDNTFYSLSGKQVVNVDKTIEYTYTTSIKLTIAEPSVPDATLTVKSGSFTGKYTDSTMDGSKKLSINPLDAITVTDAGTNFTLTTNVKSVDISYSATGTDGNGNAFGGTTTITVTYNGGQVLTIVLAKPSSNSPGNPKSITYDSASGTVKSSNTLAKNSCKAATWAVSSYSFTGTNGKTVTANGVTFDIAADTSGGGCVTPDTLITLADGTQKRIDQVNYNDQILVWNFYTGAYDVAPASIVMNHGYDKYVVTTLHFADGRTIHTINGHGFFDVATNEYVLLDAFNVSDYVGHEFVVMDGSGYDTTMLVDYSISEQYTESWSVLTAEHYNCILEGMWTVTAAEVENSPEWLMPYEIGEDMKYDVAKMQADIEKYGLYTYDDFANLCTYEQFAAFGLENFKVSVAKGYITWAEIEYLLSIHVK